MSSEPDFSELTPREIEVLDLLAEGTDSQAISAKLGLSMKTVRADVQSIMQKLGVPSRLEAAALLVRSDQDAGLRIQLRRVPSGDREMLRRWLAADHGSRAACRDPHNLLGQV